MLYDVFICHASEDKDSFIRPLAEELRKSHLEVWYDEFSLTVGDSLRESIDMGLAKSRFGIVVLSPNFFKKKWPQRELNGLVAREMDETNNVILPIWHNVSQKDVLRFSPPLADRKAIDTKKGLKAVCAELLRKLRPQESPLIVARDEIIHFGLNPPVITDEWWLDVIEASNRIPNWGAIPPPNATWGRWTFPLPNPDSTGVERGVRLAWTAMQMQWEKNVEKMRITQITKPEIVINFIASQPGLSEACHQFPEILASYAPQLTIREFSGEFEQDFDKLLKQSIKKHSRNSSSLGLITNGYSEQCDSYIALRHPSFGNYQTSSIAAYFVQGEMWGPSPKYYEIFEYLIWLLSSDSEWLPEKVHNFLIEGMKEWNVWISSKRTDLDSGVGSFLSALYDAKTFKQFKLDALAKNDLLNWIEISLNKLGLNDSAIHILNRFLQLRFIESHYKERRKWRKS
jgi:hypothetical protein